MSDNPRLAELGLDLESAQALRELEEAARGTANLMPRLKAALAAYATIGECCSVLRSVFGEYVPPDTST